MKQGLSLFCLSLGSAFLFLTSGCSEKSAEQQKQRVVVTQPQQVGGSQQSQFSGVVKEAAEIDLGFKTAGQIERIYVHEGQYVKKGQLLAALDQKDYALGVKAAEAQYNQLKGEVSRLQKLYETQGISGNDYEKALAGLQQVEVNLQNNRNKIAYTHLYAPTSGYINKVNFEVAEMVNAGTPVFVLISQGQMEIEANVPAWLYLKRDKMSGLSCKLNGATYPLTLRSISPKADNNQLYRAVFTIGQAGREITSGMNADVLITLSDATKPEGFSLPMNAVFEEQGKAYVWVVEKHTVHRREVTASTADAQGNIVISSGLNGGESIVRAGVHALQENDSVEVIEEQSATNVGNLM